MIRPEIKNPQIEKQYKIIVLKWEEDWLEERAKYPVDLFIEVDKPFEANSNFLVMAMPADRWAEKSELLNIFNHRLSKDDSGMLSAIIDDMNLGYNDSIAYFTQVVVWFIDGDINC